LSSYLKRNTVFVGSTLNGTKQYITIVCGECGAKLDLSREVERPGDFILDEDINRVIKGGAFLQRGGGPVTTINFQRISFQEAH
jgi:hypothetical protein